MASEVSPTKVTGGGGFEFEDKVAAFFMCHLLSARVPLDPRLGTIQRIDFQTRAAGWFLDDLMLTLKGVDGDRRCAFSIKSNPQFLKTTAPSDFVRAAWEQYLGEGSAPFNKNRDRFGLITSPIDIDTKTRLEDLFRKARDQESQDLAQSIKAQGYVSSEERSLFFSFSCPPDLSQKHSVNENNIGELLRSIEHLAFDFEHAASSRLSEAISILKDILESKSLDEANNLWESLCTIARSTRSQGGYIDLNKLVSELRTRYRLTNYPDHSTAWEKIKRIAREEMELIPDKIAGTISINRTHAVSEIEKKLSSNYAVALLGESGCGKTVIEKSIATSKLNSSKVVWLNTDNLLFLDEVPVHEIFMAIPDNEAFIIIDGLDQIYDTAKFKKIASLLRTCHQATVSSPWKVIVSCQPQEWDRVKTNISKLNIQFDWVEIDITNPSNKDLEPVWQNYPGLRNLSYHLHLRQFLFKPKVLDLFASKMKVGGGFDAQAFSDGFEKSPFVGESHLVSWYWDQETKNNPDGLKRGVFLKRFAATLADNLASEVQASELSIEELSMTQVLTSARILRERNEKVSFEHDLIADWARLRILIDEDLKVYEFIKDRLTSPLWCRALRLLGIHLLETEADLQKWKRIFDSFSGAKVGGNIGQDLLLEASIFSANPLGNLARLWNELQDNGGALLRRLLNRFLQSASVPSAFALLMANHYKNETTADILARYRDPYWFYWTPVIQFLHIHKEDAIQLAQKPVATIVDKWLRYSKKDWPARSEAAEFAIDMAENMLALRMSDGILLDEGGVVKLAYRAGLAACNEQPDRVIDFALTACSRKEPSGRILDLIVKYNEETKAVASKTTRPRRKIFPPTTLSSFMDKEPPPPWPNGPTFRVEHDFKDLCFESDYDSDALYPIISSYPDKALEIILALLIEEPTTRDRYGARIEQYTGLTFAHRWFPPFYTRGPFLFFLSTHPEKGIDLIISLINFATERWAEDWASEGKEPPHVEIEFPWGVKRFTGNAQTYYWHRDIGNISHIISSALMALEKWLYTRLEINEAKQETVRLIEEILRKGSSLAFIGLLVSVGKKNQELFSGPLFPLFAIPEFYSWDIQHSITGETYQMMGWGNQGKNMFDLAKEFNYMTHRKLLLDRLAISIFLQGKEKQEEFRKFREKWKVRFDQSQFGAASPDTLENLIQWFDISNWKVKHDPDHGKIIEFEMPRDIVERRQEGLKENQERQLLIMLPIKYRRILDGQEPLEPDAGVKVWNTIQQISGIVEPKDFRNNILNKNDAICGGIAVLFKHYRAWLQKLPDREKWCIDKITALILNPPTEREEFDSEYSVANWVWDRFCAEVMPIIWSDEPENPMYTSCIAILAANIHYETVSILFRAASELRGILKGHFRNLNNFLLRWSHARWKHNREKYSEKKTFDVNKWLRKEISSFDKGKSSSDQLPWEQIAKDEIKKRKALFQQEIKKRGDGWRPPREVYFDLSLIKAAFNWLPPLEQAGDKNEREEWLQFWRQALAWTLTKFEINDKEELSGTPTEWDVWLFEKLAIQVASMEDRERSDELWRPILNLSIAGHYWVSVFLMEWFIKGIGAETVPINFVKRWKEMLEFAFESAKWNPSSGYRRYQLNELWCELLGMGSLASIIWVADRKNIIKEMRSYYDRWAKSSLGDIDSAARFINFLTLPAAEEILFEALSWLDKSSTAVGDAFFTGRHNTVQKHLAGLLEISWKKYSPKLRENAEAYGAFKHLLRKLVDLQNPQAIQIQQSLI